MTPNRRAPKQERSKERYDLILMTAKQLIGEKGNDSVSMREIAKQAEIPISSIYQYFTDKNAILKAIMESYFDTTRAILVAFLNSSQSNDQLQNGVIFGIDQFYFLMQKEPTLAILWAGLQANPELREIDTQDSHKNAVLITDKILQLAPDVNRDEVFTSCLLLIHTLGMTVRLALSLEEKEGRKLLDEFKQLCIARAEKYVQNLQ